MGITQTVLYIAPVLGLNLSLTTRVYISAVIQLLVSLMETVETMFKQVQPHLPTIPPTPAIKYDNIRPSLTDFESWW